MSQLTAQPSTRASGIVEKLGLVKRIIGYENRHNFTASVAQYSTETTTTTNLELMLEGGEILPISFNSFVGYEMVGEKVTYRQTTEKVDGQLGGRQATQDTVIQELLPENQNLPNYRAVDVKFVK